MTKWDDARVERLKALFTEGKTASQIAAAFGDVTRNAVLGAIHRLKIAAQRPPKPPPPKVEKVRPVPRVKVERHAPPPRSIVKPTDPGPAPEPMPLPPPGRQVTVLMLTEQTCRWPIGDPGTAGFTFCGRRSEAGCPYCTTHARIAYRAPETRRAA